MRQTIIALLVVFSCNGLLYSQTLSEAISFEERVFNFGTILEKNGKVSHTFVFKNNGKTPVVINDIYSGCGCIGKAHSKEPVLPGAKGKMVVTFDPAYKSGFFSKEIVIYSNNSKSFNRVWVEGTITPAEHPIEEDYPYNFGSGLYLRLKVMALGYIKPGETTQMELHYANATTKEMTLNFIVKENKAGLKFNNPGKIGPKARGVMRFSYTMPAASKQDAIYLLYPYVNSKKLTETLEVKILNEVNRNTKRNIGKSVW
jgi:hypothetical protein